MNLPQSVCNYALLRFLPYPETGEFVNVGVAVNCLQPCFLHFIMEGPQMPDRVKAFFPKQNQERFEAAQAAMREEFTRLETMIKGARDPKTCQLAFDEVIRPRESVLRFGDPRTLFTTDPNHLAEELFGRYVKMETSRPYEASLEARDTAMVMT